MASGPRRGEITVLLVVWAVLGPKVGELCLSRRGFAALCRGCQWGAGGVWPGLGGRAAHVKNVKNQSSSVNSLTNGHIYFYGN